MDIGHWILLLDMGYGILDIGVQLQAEQGSIQYSTVQYSTWTSRHFSAEVMIGNAPASRLRISLYLTLPLLPAPDASEECWARAISRVDHVLLA
jgi:hypothetical protein